MTNSTHASVSIPCQGKLSLLMDYVSHLELYNKALSEYSNSARSGSGGDTLAKLKQRLEESKLRSDEALKLYDDHLEEHGC